MYSSDVELKRLCQEVLELVKGIVGLELFTREYASCHKQLGDRREERKKQKTAQVIITLLHYGLGNLLLL